MNDVILWGIYSAMDIIVASFMALDFIALIVCYCLAIKQNYEEQRLWRYRLTWAYQVENPSESIWDNGFDAEFDKVSIERFKPRSTESQAYRDFKKNRS